MQLCDSRFTIPGELDKVAFVDYYKVSQQRALVSILKSMAPSSTDDEVAIYSNCTPSYSIRAGFRILSERGYKLSWHVNCTLSPYQITKLIFRLSLEVPPNAQLQGALPALTPNIMNSILLLKDSLENLDMLVYSGTIPAKLGALNKLQTLVVRHYCMSGSLPPILLLGLPNIYRINIGQYAGGEQYQPCGLQCGIVGPVPPEWFTTTKDESGNMVAPGRLLIDVDLSNNHLTGNLPDIRAWPHVGSLSLAHNKFSGGVSVEATEQHDVWHSFLGCCLDGTCNKVKFVEACHNDFFVLHRFAAL